MRGADRNEAGLLSLAFESGAVASIGFADTTPSPWGFEAGIGENPHIATTSQDMLFVTGDRGAISFPSLSHWTGAQDWSQAPQAQAEIAEVTVPLAAQLTHFCDVIAGRVAPLCTLADGRETLRVTLQAEEALNASRRGQMGQKPPEERHA